MLCSNCGYQIDDSAKFCTNCGQNIVEDTVQLPPSDKELAPENIGHATEMGEADNAALGENNSPESSHGKQTSLAPTKVNSLLPLLNGWFHGFSWLIPAVFFLNGDFLVKSLVLAITHKAVSELWTPMSGVLSYLAAIFFLVGYIGYKHGQKFTLDKYLKALVSTLASGLLLFGAFALFGIITGSLYSQVISFGMDSPGKGILLLSGYVLLLLVLQLVLIAALIQLYASIKHNISFLQTGPVMKKVFFSILRHLPGMLVFTVLLGVLLVAVFFIQDLGGIVIKSLQPYGFMQAFLQYLLAAILTSFMFALIFNKGEAILAGKEPEFSDIVTTGKKSIAPLLLLVPVIAAFILYPPASQESFSKVQLEIESLVNRGDILLETGYTPEAVKQYDMALSRLEALEGYITARNGIITKNPQLVSGGNKLLTAAMTLDRNNGYVPVFQGKLALEQGQADNALQQLEQGKKNTYFLAENYLELMKAYEATGDKKASSDILDWLLKSQSYHDGLKGLEKAGLKRVDSWLEQLAAIRAEVEPRQMHKYYEKTLMNAHQEALNGLLPLRDKYPENPEINYMLSRIYAEYRSEQGNYKLMVQSADEFGKYIEAGGDPALLLMKDTYLAQLNMMADDSEKAEEIYRNLHKRYPEDEKTLESFLYTLVRNKKHQEALELIGSTVKNRSMAVIYQHALALLNMDRHDESLAVIHELTGFRDPYSEEYDRFLYAYSLAYTNAAKNADHINLVMGKPEDMIIKHYILAMKGWRDKNSDESDIHLDKVIDMDDRLGYAWYCRGVNSYERSVRTSSGDFEAAASSYLKAVSVLPDYVEGYFALGHSYKKAGLKKEALRAFRKVLELVPYEDHRVDPYGMVIHSGNEVNSLKNELGEEAE